MNLLNTLKLAFCCFGITILCTKVQAAEITVKSTVNSVTIYHTGALVKRTVQLDIPAGTSVLSFENISAKSLMNSFKLDAIDLSILNRTMIQKLSEENHQRLRDEKASLTNQLTLLESKYNEVGFIKDVAELEKMMALYSQRIVDIKRKMRSTNDQLAAAEKLEAFNIKNSDAGILQLTISTPKAFKKSVGLQYLVGGIGWSPSYDISVTNVSSSTVELKYMAKVMSQTGEDWDNVTIQLSSEFPLAEPKELPKSDGPWVLNQPRKDELPKGFVQGSAQAYEWQANNGKSLANAGGIQDLQGISYEILRVPTFLENRQLEGRFTLKSNSTVFTYPILNANLPARFYYYAYPSLDAEAYLVAEITEWETYGFMDAVANIRYKGNDAGRSTIRFSESYGTLLLPIGQDNSIFLKYEEIADEKYFKEVWASKKHKTTMAYSYKVKNNNNFPIAFHLVDQVPIAQKKTDEITIDELSGGIKNERTGEIKWAFNLAPGKLIEKQLIYTIETEGTVIKNYKTMRKKKSQYRGVSSPRFM